VFLKIATVPHIMSSVIDLEAQQVAQTAPRASAFFPLSHHRLSGNGSREEVGGTGAHEMDILGPHTSGQDINDEAHSTVSVAEGVASICPCCLIPRRLFCSVAGSGGGGDAPEMNIDQSHSRDDVSHTTSDKLTQAEAQIRACSLFPHDCTDLNDLTNINIAVASIPTFNPGLRNTTSDSESEDKTPRMIGDFDGSANEFWKLYRDEAKSHDDARIGTLKEGMESALIFVSSYSVHAPIMLMRGPTGWFILCCSHSICSR
jgi:hypothetical protein